MAAQRPYRTCRYQPALWADLGTIKRRAQYGPIMSEDRAERIEQLGSSGGVVVARTVGRRFPCVLVQGDTLFALLTDLEEEAPESEACRRP